MSEGKSGKKKLFMAALAGAGALTAIAKRRKGGRGLAETPVKPFDVPDAGIQGDFKSTETPGKGF